MENNQYHSASHRHENQLQMIGQAEKQQNLQNQSIPIENETNQSHSHEIRLGHSNELKLEHYEDQIKPNSSLDDYDSRLDKSDNLFNSADRFGYWFRDGSSGHSDDDCDTFEQYLDGLSRDRNEPSKDNNATISDRISKEVDDSVNDCQEEESFTSGQQINETIEFINESMESYKSSKLNETYPISQDAESDYSNGFRRSSSGLTIHDERDNLPQRTKLRDLVDPVEREKMFQQYIDDCCKIYDFRNEHLDDLDLRDGKMVMLSEFFGILLEDPDLLAPFDSLYDQIFKLFSVNVFRVLPPSSNQNVPEFDPEEDEPPLEPSWPHLQLVYHVMLRFTGTSLFEPDRARSYIDEKFVFKLLQLFESEDPRERSYLKSILHRVYGHFLSLRAYIRKQIGIIFSTFIYENEYHNGIADLLEILGSIINGFVQPLKEEHKVFLLKILMPLHKARTLGAYHTQLAVCIVQYIEKDPTLTKPIVDQLLRYWPKVHSTKEVMFLNQIEEILDIIEPVEFQKIMTSLFRQLARCIQSDQFQVAERVLYFWNNEYILSLINDNIHAILPIVIPALHVDPKSHWNKTIHGLIYNALKISTQMNQRLFHDLVQQQDKLRMQEEFTLRDKDRKWQRIQVMANENASKML